MSFLLSRNPLFAAVRALIGLGLLGYGLLGFSAANSGTAAAITPSAYLALPQCPGDPVPTSGACYSVRPGTVLSSRQQLTTYWVTISDGRASHEVELANGNRFDTFQPNTAVAVKYWKASVTAVGVPVAGDPSALTSTVDSPLGHSDALGHSLRYMAAGLVGLVLGVVPLLLGLSRRSGRGSAPVYPGAAYGPDGAPLGAAPALYSPPVPVTSLADGAQSQGPLPAGTAGSPPPLPAAVPAAARGFQVSTTPAPAPAAAAPGMSFVLPTAQVTPAGGAGSHLPGMPVASTPGAGCAGPTPAEPLLHPFAPPSAPTPTGPVPPVAQPTFTVLGAPPAGSAPHPAIPPPPPASTVSAPAAATTPSEPPASRANGAGHSGAALPQAPQPRWGRMPAASVHFPAPTGPPLATSAPAPVIPMAVVTPLPIIGADPHPAPVGQASAPSAPFAAPAFSVLPPPPPAGSTQGSSCAPPAAPVSSPPDLAVATSEAAGGPGWGVRQGPGPGPRQAG